ncbi:MAG: hypothetical protein D6737_06075 [Chloroflexi bacterium]|nr:MAG: hypothetical protein D6737_06075 [Chloroflexota bacterium]
MINRLKLFTLFVLLLAGLSIAPVNAHAQQSGCPVIVQNALALTEQICSVTGRNQVCYGNINITSQPQPNVQNFVFNAPGDITNITDIQNMTLSRLDEATNVWGVALMRLQANLPGTLPGQNVSILAFGDVQFQDISSQAFIFQSGIGDAPCAGAPQSGILVQTPEGAGLVNMTVNGVNVALGSTAFMQAQPSQQMTINLINGQGLIGAQGQVASLPGGNSLSVPMTSNLQPGGAPGSIQPLDFNTLQGLPLDTLNNLDMMSTAGGQSTSQQQQQQPAQPCTVRANRDGVLLHVGPGVNRGVLGTMPNNTDIPVIGKNNANDGSLWYRLDKSVAAPGSAANEVWVAAENVTTMGACDQVGDADAPPIIVRPSQPQQTEEPSPSATEDPNAGSGMGEPFISFTSNRDFVNANRPCVRIMWSTENIESVFFEGRGVVGNSEERVCPTKTTTYTLLVNLRDGTQQTRTITIRYESIGTPDPYG